MSEIPSHTQQPEKSENPQQYLKSHMREEFDAVTAWETAKHLLLSEKNISGSHRFLSSEIQSVQDSMLNILLQNKDIARDVAKWKPMADRLLLVYFDRLQEAKRRDMQKSITANIVPVSDKEFDAIRTSIQHEGEVMIKTYERNITEGKQNPFENVTKPRTGTITPIWTEDEVEEEKEKILDREKNGGKKANRNKFPFHLDGVIIEKEASLPREILDAFVDPFYNTINAKLSIDDDPKASHEAFEEAILFVGMNVIGAGFFQNFGKTLMIKSPRLAEVFEKYTTKISKEFSEKRGLLWEAIMKKFRNNPRYTSSGKASISTDVAKEKLEIQAKKDVSDTAMSPKKIQKYESEVDSLMAEAKKNNLFLNKNPKTMRDYDVRLAMEKIRQGGLSREEKIAEIQKIKEAKEFARETGETISHFFQAALHNCKHIKAPLTEFKNMPHGKKAVEMIERLPEPFRTNSKNMLAEFEKNLHKRVADHTDKNGQMRSAEEIYTHFFGKNPDKNAGKIEVHLNPFSSEFVIDSGKNFNQIYGHNNADVVGGFSQTIKGKGHVTVAKKESNRLAYIQIHETEHALHAVSSPIRKKSMPNYSVAFYENGDIRGESLRDMREYFRNSLEKAKDEIFAYKEDGSSQKYVTDLLIKKREYDADRKVLDGIYDYNYTSRTSSFKNIDNAPISPQKKIISSLLSSKCNPIMKDA